MNSQIDKEKKRERYREIRQILEENGEITVAEIAARFQVTSETARKDLKELEKSGIVKRYHGGAKTTGKNDFKEGPLLQNRMIRHAEIKQTIAYKAAELVQENVSVMIDSGSTAYMLVRQLLGHDRIMLITSSLPAAMLAAENGVRTLMLGGEVFQADNSVGGPWIRSCLNTTFADIAFIGASSISNAVGPAVENFAASEAKSEMLRHARKKYVIADSTKYEESSMIAFCRWEEIDGIIVDKAVPQDFLEMVRGKTQVIFADTMMRRE